MKAATMSLRSGKNLRTSAFHGGFAIGVTAMAVLSCSNASIIDNGQGGANGPGGAGAGGGHASGSGGGFTLPLPTTPDGAVDRPVGGSCGDGIIERNEGCDDGNTTSGDGCSRICQVEANWYCPTEGEPCQNLAKCGNGILTSDEVCDDHNTNSGDGCSGDCKTIEKGYQCRVPGKPCTPKCGDGILSATEACDDGNTTSGDGCSATCHLEVGWKCDGTPTKCSKTTCGDGKKEGAETCDDGNTMPFDGCSEDCQLEPPCKSGEGCTSQCGDGIVLGEECDDGNAADGDGCSSKCKKESGWTCKQPDIGDKMLVPVVYRDFRFQHPTDFEAGVSGSYNPLTGIVKDTLDAKGKPVYTGNVATAHIASTDSFSQWYTDASGINHPTAAKMTLWNDGKGNYVNRYGANGEQWQTTKKAYYCGTVGRERMDANGKPIPCTSSDPNPTDCDTMVAAGGTLLTCNQENGSYTAMIVVAEVDGNPLFFPVDGDTFTPASELTAATIPPYYDASATWPFDVDASGNKRLHNFSFTSEVRYWFPYDKNKSYTLDFVGDDDVWVFINGKLAVDLGGVHTPVDGQVVIGADGNGNTTVTATYPLSPAPTPTKQTANLGLQSGKVYEIAVFQAERQTNGSSYKLTLGGFNAAPTSCVPTCGDGVAVADEECDCGKDASSKPASCSDPNSDTAYGGCTTKCTWGGYCGDGIVNGKEECDSGKANGTDGGPNGCTLGCTKASYCGDGKADTARGEECDLGDRNGQTLDKQLVPSTAAGSQVYCNNDCSIPPTIVY